jgi:hypothetical protein
MGIRNLVSSIRWVSVAVSRSVTIFFKASALRIFLCVVIVVSEHVSEPAGGWGCAMIGSHRTKDGQAKAASSNSLSLLVFVIGKEPRL